jgi:flagellar secretion chaperone FliS
MRAANPWKSYRETATLTAPPGQIVLMLFEGAIRSLERSLPGFTISDPGESNMIIHNNLQRAQEIIRELNSALDMEQGGEFSTNMRRLYNYLERRIWESNLKKNSTGIGEVIGHLTVLRDAWATMLNNQGSPAPEARPALAAA